MERQFFQSAAVVSGMTLVSRILGFVRDMLIARMFGADFNTDAFFIAFKIPNFFRRLFVEGAFAQAFVPALIDYERHDCPLALQRFIDKTGGTLALLAMTMVIVGMVAAPMLIVLFAPGFVTEGDVFALAVQMLQMTLPYLFFIVSVAFAGSILNVHGRFAVPAITPVLLNAGMIAAALWLSPMMAEPILALAWGVLLAGLLQLLMQFPALRRLHLMPRLQWGFSDSAVKRVLKSMAPAVFAVSVTQLNLLLDSCMASFLDVGSVSWLYYSDRLVEFPLGVLGVASATVILPKLSRDYGADDSVAFSRTLDWGLKWVLLLSVPATIGLVLLAEPILFTLFQYNEFSAGDVHLAGQSLMAYAVGLSGFMLIKVLATGFSAGKNLTTPVRFGVYALASNLVLSLLLVFPLAHTGLALATSLAALVNAGLLGGELIREQVYRPGQGWPDFLGKILLASAGMALMLYVFVEPSRWQDGGFWGRATQLLFWLVLSVVVYASILGAMGLKFSTLMGAKAR